MKRLIYSSKFWLAVIGAIVALLTHKLTDDAAFAMYVSGLFGIGILGNTAEDLMEKNTVKGLINTNSLEKSNN